MTPAALVDFERLSPYIQEALGYTGGSHTLEHVRQGLDDGILQFWPAPHSFAITEVRRMPSGRKAIHVFLAGGQLEELEPLGHVLEAWGRAEGAQEMSCLGRFGWQRTFLTKRAGWIPSLVLYRKTLDTPAHGEG